MRFHSRMTSNGYYNAHNRQGYGGHHSGGYNGNDDSGYNNAHVDSSGYNNGYNSHQQQQQQLQQHQYGGNSHNSFDQSGYQIPADRCVRKVA